MKDDPRETARLLIDVVGELYQRGRINEREAALLREAVTEWRERREAAA